MSGLPEWYDRTRTPATADAIYAELRRVGELTITAGERSTITTLRRRAKADGLALTVYTARGRDARRAVEQENAKLALVDPANPRYIVHPDAP